MTGETGKDSSVGLRGGFGRPQHGEEGYRIDEV